MGKPVSMHFADYLKLLPSKWVFENFIKISNSSRKILSSSMIEEAVKHFTSQSTLLEKFSELDFEQRLRCSLVYLSGNTGVYSPGPPVLEDPLIKSFFVFAAKEKGGNVKLFGFAEFEPSLRDLIAQTIIEAAKVSDFQIPAPVWQYKCLNDITVIAGLASQRLLCKKRSGGLTRASSLQIKKLIDSGTGSKSDGGDFLASLTIAYGMKEQFIFETERDYLFYQETYDFWQKEPQSKHYQRIVDFIFEFAGGWNKDLFLKLLSLSHGEWLSISIFPDDDKKIFINMLRASKFAGLVELRRKGNDLHFCAVKTIKPSDIRAAAIIVLPDFSMILPQESTGEQIFRSTQICRLNSFDKVYKGKIEKEVIGDSLSRGVSGDMVMEWLAMWRAPSNVQETVREWLREFNRLYIMEKSVLVSINEKVSKQINSFEPLRSLVEPIKAHTLFRIQDGREEKVRELLKTMGFDYRMPGQDQNIPAPRPIEPIFPEEQWAPVTESQEAPIEKTVPMRGTKYGTEMKELEMNEMVHVIDYAILTGQHLAIEYEGSPYIKQNTYIVLPISCQRGIEPMLDAEVPRTRTRKQFYINKIKKIGVLPK